MLGHYLPNSLFSWDFETKILYSCVTSSVPLPSSAPWSNHPNIIDWIAYLLGHTVGARVGVMVKALRYKPQVAGSIPDGVIVIFQWHNPTGRTMALGSTSL